jgi:hypothetical protein
MENWYCLDSRGELWLLGRFSSFDEADQNAEKQGHEAIWLANEKNAKQWRNTLSEVA